MKSSIFFCFDECRYKPVIIFSALCGCMVFALMLWMDEFIGLIFAQTFYGTFMATEVAYYTYIYAKVERSKYQMVTGHTRSAILGGRFLGAVFAQILITCQWMNYRQLNYLSFGCKRKFSTRVAHDCQYYHRMSSITRVNHRDRVLHNARGCPRAQSVVIIFDCQIG